MIVTHNINLDLRSEYMLGIKIPQYTKDSHKLVVTVSDNGTPKTFNTSNETVKFKANTPGEHYYYLDTTLTANNITITLPKEISAYAGRVQALFEISNSAENSIQSTMKFYIMVTPSVYDEDVIVNSDIFTSLTQRLNQVDAMITEANGKLASLNRSVSEMNTLLSTTQRNVTQKMAEVDTTVADKMTSVDGTVATKMSAVDTTISTKLDSVDTLVDNKMDSVDTTIQNKMNAVDSTISDKMDAVDTLVDGKLDSYDTAIADKITEVNTALDDAETALTNKLSAVDTALAQKLAAVDTTIQNKMDNVDATISAKEDELDELIAGLQDMGIATEWLSSPDRIIDSKLETNQL